MKHNNLIILLFILSKCPIVFCKREKNVAVKWEKNSKRYL